MHHGHEKAGKLMHKKGKLTLGKLKPVRLSYGFKWTLFWVS